MGIITLRPFHTSPWPALSRFALDWYLTMQARVKYEKSEVLLIPYMYKNIYIVHTRKTLNIWYTPGKTSGVYSFQHQHFNTYVKKPLRMLAQNQTKPHFYWAAHHTCTCTPISSELNWNV